MSSPHMISKTLSANDTGSTGGHQAGILIPKKPEILSFFPALDQSEKNPRVHLEFTDEDGKKWIFAFIYYNNQYFGGTRNEFRLTRMTSYIRLCNLEERDEIILTKNEDGTRYIKYRRANPVLSVKDSVLRLSPSWKVISF